MPGIAPWRDGLLSDIAHRRQYRVVLTATQRAQNGTYRPVGHRGYDETPRSTDHAEHAGRRAPGSASPLACWRLRRRSISRSSSRAGTACLRCLSAAFQSLRARRNSTSFSGKRYEANATKTNVTQSTSLRRWPPRPSRSTPLATLNPPTPAFAAAYRGGPVSERHSTRKHQRRLVSQNGETTGSRGAQEPVRRAVENGGNLPACSS